MEALFTIENLIALVTLTSLEVVLGIDNIVFIAILVGKLHPKDQAKARRIGLGLAMIARILLLLSLSWVLRLTQPLFEVLGQPFSGRDIILLLGGLFLIAKATHEIHDNLEVPKDEITPKAAKSFKGVLIQIILLDIIFSLDSVITAIGMAQSIEIMIAAVIIAVGIMLISSATINSFIERHPTFRMLALSFLLLIGVMLVADSFGKHINKGYIYFAMGFSLLVEMLNMKVRKKGQIRV